MTQNFVSEILPDPYPSYEKWREEQPIWWADDSNGWVLSRYEDVIGVLKNPKVFSSSGMGERDENVIALPLLTDDPPRHTQLRSIINKVFTSRYLNALAEEIDDLVEGMLDDFEGQETVDICQALTIPLPVALIAKLMGIPFERKDDFKRWSDALTNTASGQTEEQRMPEIMAMAEYFQALLPERRAGDDDDLISKLVHASVDGEAMTDEDIVGFCMLLLIAGNETTTNLISNFFYYAANNLDLWSELRADPSKVDAAVEETLRHQCPVHWVARKAMEDTEFHGQPVKAGELVYVIMGAANRDPRQFENAHEFRLDRERNDHLTFGHGIHFCMGALLGRMEARSAIRGMLQRYKSIHHPRGADNEPTHSSMLRGYHHLWLGLETG